MGKKLSSLGFLAAFLTLCCGIASAIDAEKVTQLARQVHTDFRKQVIDQKVPRATALLKQHDILRANQDVASVARQMQ